MASEADVAVLIANHVGFVVQLKLVFSVKKSLISTAFTRPLVRKIDGAVYLRNASCQILTIRAEHVSHFTVRLMRVVHRGN